MTPFGKSGSAVLLEDIAAVEVTVLVEVIVDRSMGGGKFLQGLYVSELRHRAFSSSERLVGILGTIVEPSSAFLTIHDSNNFHRGTAGAKAVGYKLLRSTETLHRALQKFERSPAIPALRGEDLEHLAFVIDGGLEIMRLAIDPHEHLLHVPAPARIRPVLNASFLISAANIGPNRFHHNRAVSWQMSMPRSNNSSATCRSDSG